MNWPRSRALVVTGGSRIALTMASSVTTFSILPARSRM